MYGSSIEVLCQSQELLRAGVACGTAVAGTAADDDGGCVVATGAGVGLPTTLLKCALYGWFQPTQTSTMRRIKAANSFMRERVFHSAPPVKLAPKLIATRRVPLPSDAMRGKANPKKALENLTAAAAIFRLRAPVLDQSGAHTGVLDS